MELSFTKNGKWMGIAFRIQKEALGGQALYPHVLVKNCAVEFSFGQRAEPYCSVLPGFTFIQHLPLSERIRGTVGPKTKAECEVSGPGGRNWSLCLQGHLTAKAEGDMWQLGVGKAAPPPCVCSLRERALFFLAPPGWPEVKAAERVR